MRALDGLAKLWERCKKVAVHGHREYNPGWHTALDLNHLLTVSEAITRSASSARKAGAGTFRDDFPNKDAESGKMNIVVHKDSDGSMRTRRERFLQCRNTSASHRRDGMNTKVFKIWRGDANGGDFVDYETKVSEGMVVLDAVHEIQATQANDLACRWNCKAGKCGSCSAEINGMPKLMCMTRLDELPADKPVTIEPMSLSARS